MTHGSGPYREGYDAYWAAIMYEQNPYDIHDYRHHLWSLGYSDAETADDTEADHLGGICD